VIQREAVHWVDLGDPVGSRPGKRRPVLVIQSDHYNASRLSTVLVAVLTSNTKLAAMPGSVFLPARATRLPLDSVVNVTALVTLDTADLAEPAGEVPLMLTRDVDAGLRRVLEL
jgi:mRNA interferase MazF